MKETYQTFSNNAECLRILKDPSYMVPEYGLFFKNLSTQTGKSFPHLTRVFSENLFGLSGEAHLNLKKRLLPCLNKGTIQQAHSGFSKIINEELLKLTPGVMDLIPFTERVSYRCMYHYLGINELHHDQYLSALEALREVVDNTSPKKMSDYEAIENKVAMLFSLLKPQLACSATEVAVCLRRELKNDEETCATAVVLLAGSGAMASTLANMLLFVTGVTIEERKSLHVDAKLDQTIDKLLYWCGGTKYVYRKKGKNQHEFLKLDIDTASKTQIPREEVFSDSRPTRNANLSFGAGEHKCIGEMLSRKILGMTISAFFEKYPSTTSYDGDSREFFLFAPRKELLCHLN